MRRGGSCRPFSCQTRRFLGGFLGLPPEQLSKKGDGPRYAQCARAVSGPQPPPLWTRRWMNAYILTLGRNFLTAWRNAVTGRRARGLQSRTGGNAEEPRLNVPLRECEVDRRMPVRREGEGAPEVAWAGGDGGSRLKRVRTPADGVRLPCGLPASLLYHSGCFVRERPEAGRVGGQIAASADQGPPTSLSGALLASCARCARRAASVIPPLPQAFD